jgi:hypothetical protein
MHQSHDQEIGKKVAALAVGKHNKRFQSSLEFGETGIARKSPDGAADVLLSDNGPFVSEVP